MSSTSQSADTYLIFPPWAQFAFGWEELPDVFLAPERYGIGTEAEKCADLGYSVSPGGHQFISGPDGGGLIVVRRDIRRWFPAVLLRTTMKFATPPGFSRNVDYGLHVIIPAVKATHRLGETPMPLAPSPFFSVDRIAGGNLACCFALGLDFKGVKFTAKPPSSFPALGLSVEPLEDVPNFVRDTFESIQAKQPRYCWFHVQHTGVDPRALFAALIYLGLSVPGRTNGSSTTGSLKAFHIFCSELLPGMEYLSATRWKHSRGVIRKAVDW